MNLKKTLLWLTTPKQQLQPRSTDLVIVKGAVRRSLADRLFAYLLDRYLSSLQSGFHIKVNGRIVLESTTDLILLSGREANGEPQKNPKRPGYFHSIWNNPSFDHNGDPLLKIAVYDENDQTVIVDAQFDEEGILRPCQRLRQVKQHPHLEG